MNIKKIVNVAVVSVLLVTSSARAIVLDGYKAAPWEAEKNHEIVNYKFWDCIDYPQNMNAIYKKDRFGNDLVLIKNEWFIKINNLLCQHKCTDKNIVQ